MRRPGRKVMWLVVSLIAILVAFKLLVTWMEPRLAFYPEPGVQETPSEESLPFDDVQIRTDDGETLHAWWLDNPAARAHVIFWHGNGGNLSTWLPAIAGLRRHGFSVLAVDYRGYGASSGTPSERGLYRDADAATALYAQRFRRPGMPVVYWGRSVGTAVASYAASRITPDALVLESPFPDVWWLLDGHPVFRVMALFSSYRFATATFLEHYDGPLLVVHGDSDSIVPYRAGRAVFDGAHTTRKTFVTIPGADHNDLHSANPDVYWKAIDDWVEGLRR